MATVEPYELAGGAKRYRVRYRTPERKSAEKAGFTTKRDAQTFANTIEVTMAKGDYVAPASGKATIGSLSDAYLSQAHVKATTASKWRSAWEYRVGPRWSETAIGEVRPSAIKSWVSELKADGVGAASIESALGVLRGILEAAKEDRLITVNHAAGIKAPKRGHVQRGYLSHQQVSALTDELSRGDAVFVAFLAYTGLRFGEAAALRVSSFDMLRRRVNITEAVAEDRGKLVTSTPKDHERRTVPFPAFLANEISALMVGKSRGALVFCSQKGVQRRVSVFRPKMFLPAVRRVQLSDPDFPSITPHDLRHTAASLAISAGANVKGVQTMLGHASAAMTLDTYADLFPDDLDAVAARLDEARSEKCGVFVGFSGRAFGS
jgi:integrase